MSDNSGSGVNSFDALAEEFVARHRRGDKASVSEYAAKHPELADDIRDLFPGLLLMEDVRPGTADATGPFSGGAPRPSLDRLGDYRILREIGRGGMGIVYEAEQISLGRHVALKVLPSHGLMNPTFLERFRREAKAAARLHHTNIVPVFGVGDADGVHYYAMQFIQGQSLDQVLADVRRLRKSPSSSVADATGSVGQLSVAQGMLTGQFEKPSAEGGGKSDPPTIVTPPISPGPRSSAGLSAGGSEAQYCRSVARVGLQAADGLAYAHRQGVLHRDVKPSNLLLDQQGTVWITDFGLAKADGADELTQTGDIVGTIRFMAPERFDGRSLPQSDVYSLGLTLYEMLTLRPALNDMNKARLIEQVLHDPPVSPRKIDPHIPRDLETIVLKCLAKDVAGRYATADELADDLRRFLADRTIRARRASSAEQTWRWCRRNPVVASLLAAVAILLVVIAVVSTFSAASLKTALTKTEAAERESRLREAEALVGEAHGIRYSRRPGQRFESLAALDKAAGIGRELGQPPEWFDRLRNESIAALALPDVHITQTWDGFPPGTRRAEVSLDFELYARTTQKGDCSVRRIADDTEIAGFPEMGEPAAANFGPGRLLVIYGETSRRYQLWDLSGPEPLLRLDQRQITADSFSSDGRVVLLGSGDGSMRVYATDTGACKYRLAPSGITKGHWPSLHPSGLFVATSSYWSNLLQVRDVRTGSVLITVQLTGRGFEACAWSLDGRTLAIPDGDSGQVHLYAFEPAGPVLRLTRTLTAPGNGGTAAHFNPTGDRLFTRGWNTVINLFDVVNGRLLFSTSPLPPLSHGTLRVASSGDRLAGARVGPEQRQIGVWSVSDGREYRSLVHDGLGRRYHECWGGPAIHPAGRLAALGMSNGVALFDLESGRELAFLSIPRGGGNPCFDGAGNLFTNTPSGLFRWPVVPDGMRPDKLIVGPPQRLPSPHVGDREVATSRDGRVIAQANYGSGCWVLHPNAPQPRQVAAGRCNHVSVSPDGRWVACIPHDTGVVNVYEAATGRCVWQSPEGGQLSRFSPDGRWLVTPNDGGRAYRVGTWQPGPRLGPGVPWDISPDSRLVVLGLWDGVNRLVELATGRELARLEDPEQLAASARFTPDGTRLVVSAEDGLHVWELRRIRKELVKLGLDWDAPPYPSPSEEKDREPLHVTVDLGELAPKPPPPAVVKRAPEPPQLAVVRDSLAIAWMPVNPEAYLRRGRAYYQMKQYRQAADDLGVALALNPGVKEAQVWFELGYSCGVVGRPQQAIVAYSRTVELFPNFSGAWNNRGLLHEQLGQLEQAVADYAKSLAANDRNDIAWNNRARVHARLGRWGAAVEDCSRFLALVQGPRQTESLHRRATAYAQLGRYREALADYHKLLELAPNSALAHNDLSWLLATCPETKLRDPARAVELARRAVALQEPVGNVWNTLGAAHYRAGAWRPAIEALEKSMALRQGGDAFDWFFLALAHHKLGHADEAKKWYDKAVDWLDKNGPALAKTPQHAAELRRFRDEAEEVLGVKK